MKKKAALTIVKPSAIQLPAMTPPPRKEDIVAGLVERARVKHAEESRELATRKNAAREVFDKAALEHFKKHPEAFEVRVSTYGNSVDIEHTMKVMPPHLLKLKRDYEAIPTLGLFNPAEVKKMIRDGMGTQGDRVKALLANPEAVKKLDEMLTTIGA